MTCKPIGRNRKQHHLVKYLFCSLFNLCIHIFFSSIFVFLALPRRRIKSKNRPKGYWAKTENLKNFLTEFAQKHGFDPTDAEAWHNVGYTTLKKSPVRDYSSSLFFIFGLNISDPPLLLNDRAEMQCWHISRVL